MLAAESICDIHMVLFAHREGGGSDASTRCIILWVQGLKVEAVAVFDTYPQFGVSIETGYHFYFRCAKKVSLADFTAGVGWCRRGVCGRHWALCLSAKKMKNTCLPLPLLAAVDGGHDFIALHFSCAPQNRHVGLHSRMQNLNAEQPIPLAHARSPSHVRPRHGIA